jgi:hypothetical protein
VGTGCAFVDFQDAMTVGIVDHHRAAIDVFDKHHHLPAALGPNFRRRHLASGSKAQRRRPLIEIDLAAR